MTLHEVLPSVASLSHAEKFQRVLVCCGNWRRTRASQACQRPPRTSIHAVISAPPSTPGKPKILMRQLFPVLNGVAYI